MMLIYYYNYRFSRLNFKAISKYVLSMRWFCIQRALELMGCNLKRIRLSNYLTNETTEVVNQLDVNNARKIANSGRKDL